MPDFVPTLRTFHCCPDGLLLGMDVAFRDAHAAVPCEVRERPRVHVRCPPRQAGVPQRVQRERLHFGSLASLKVLTLQAGRFDVPAPGLGREDPLTILLGRPPHVQERGDALRDWDSASGVLCLAVANLKRFVPHVLPAEPGALLRPYAAVERNHGNVPKQRAPPLAGSAPLPEG